jgi:hypothetical protein
MGQVVGRVLKVCVCVCVCVCDAVSLVRRLGLGFPQRRPKFVPSSCGICGRQSDTGVDFLQELLFTCQFLFQQLLYTHLSPGDGTMGQLVAEVPSGLSLTPPHII